MMTYSFFKDEPAWYRGFVPLRWSFSFFLGEYGWKSTDSFGWSDFRPYTEHQTA